MPSRTARDDDASATGRRADTGGSEVVEYREAHRLSAVFPLLYDVLGRAAEESNCIVTLTDAQGRLLWACGQPAELLQAEGVDFVAGTRPTGRSAVPIVDLQVQIHGTEHRSLQVRPRSSAAAPVHDPNTHAILGVVDVSGADGSLSAMTTALVRAAARMAEAELARVQVVTAEEPATAAQDVRIDALGRLVCHVEIDGRARWLSPRHSEIAVILADHPDGLSGDQLAIALYPGDALTSTLRAEVTRLRGVIGPLHSRLYRLTGPVRCDWQRVHEHLAAGRIGDALRDYRGPLLPNSVAPWIVERREQVQLGLRTAVLGSGQPELMVS